jgi:hypothetical protein
MNARRLKTAAVVSGFTLSLMAAGAGSAHAVTQLELHLRTPYPAVKCFTLWDEQSGSKKVVKTADRQLPADEYFVTGAWESAEHMKTEQTIVYYADANCTDMSSRGLVFFNPDKNGQKVGNHYNVDLTGMPLEPCGARGQSCP